jgi:hypothetical protein
MSRSQSTIRFLLEHGRRTSRSVSQRFTASVRLLAFAKGPPTSPAFAHQPAGLGYLRPGRCALRPRPGLAHFARVRRGHEG